MGDNNIPSNREQFRNKNQLTRRPFLRRTASVLVGGLGVTTLSNSAAAGMTVGLEVTSTINIENRGVIPVEVKGVAPMFLPLADQVDVRPRFGPSRLFQCDVELFQQQDPDLCALQQAEAADDGATPIRSHRLGNGGAMLHFSTRDAGFTPADIEDDTIEVNLLYAIEDEAGVLEAFVGTDVAKAQGVPPMN